MSKETNNMSKETYNMSKETCNMVQTAPAAQHPNKHVFEIL